MKGSVRHVLVIVLHTAEILVSTSTEKILHKENYSKGRNPRSVSLDCANPRQRDKFHTVADRVKTTIHKESATEPGDAAIHRSRPKEDKEGRQFENSHYHYCNCCRYCFSCSLTDWQIS